MSSWARLNKSKFYVETNSKRDNLFQIVIKACMAHQGFTVIQDWRARSVIKKHMNVEHVMYIK